MILSFVGAVNDTVLILVVDEFVLFRHLVLVLIHIIAGLLLVCPFLGCFISKSFSLLPLVLELISLYAALLLRVIPFNFLTLPFQLLSHVFFLLLNKILLSLLIEPLSLLDELGFGIDFCKLLIGRSLRFLPLPLNLREILCRLLGQCFSLLLDLGKVLCSFLRHCISFLLDRSKILRGLLS